MTKARNQNYLLNTKFKIMFTLEQIKTARQSTIRRGFIYIQDLINLGVKGYGLPSCSIKVKLL
jgi:hypothetical protein